MKSAPELIDAVTREGLSPGETVLIVVGGVLTIALITMFVFILRAAFKEENEAR